MAKDEPTEEPKLEETPVEEPKEEQPKEEPAQPEEPAPEVEEPEAPEPDAPEETEAPPMSRREQLRVQDLLKKYPNLNQPETKVQAPNFRDKIQADEDTFRLLEETTQDFGRNLLEEATARSNYSTWHRFLQLDDKTVTAAHPELDKNNQEKFHPALADAINRKYLQQVGFNPGNPEQGIPPSVQNPSISYADFVESELEYAQEMASMLAEDSRRNIAKQAANTGIRPDASTPKRLNLNKPPEQMSDEELKAAIAQSGL